MLIFKTQYIDLLSKYVFSKSIKPHFKNKKNYGVYFE